MQEWFDAHVEVAQGKNRNEWYAVFTDLYDSYKRYIKTKGGIPVISSALSNFLWTYGYRSTLLINGRRKHVFYGMRLKKDK